MNRKGSVLLHVLVTGVLVALIATNLLRLALLRYQVSNRARATMQEKRSADASLALIMTNWSMASSYTCGVATCYDSVMCANNVPGYTCAPASTTPPGTCACTCTPASATDATVTAAVDGSGRCLLSIVSADLQ